MLRIIGIGNRIYGDDGVGPCLAAALKRCSRYDGEKLSIVSLDLPSHGDVALMEGADVIILLDAAVDGETRLYKVDLDRALPDELMDLAMSSAGHGISALNLLALARAAGALGRDQEVYMLDIGPLAPSFGSGLSRDAVSKALEALRLLVRVAKSHGYELEVDEGCVRSFLEGPCSDPLLPLDMDSRD
ncbi:hydrogenase maturation protease [Stetteria hydrogenophila]